MLSALLNVWLLGMLTRLEGGRWFPGPSSGGQWPLRFTGRAPPYPPLGRFGCTTAHYVDRPQAAMGSRHGAGSGLWSRPRRRSNSNHAGKSTYSGEIESLETGNCDSRPRNAIFRELASLKGHLIFNKWSKWYDKAASTLCVDPSIVFTRWRQCAPISSAIFAQFTLCIRSHTTVKRKAWIWGENVLNTTTYRPWNMQHM